MWPTSSLADGRDGEQLIGLALVLAAVRDADQPTGFFRLPAFSLNRETIRRYTRLALHSAACIKSLFSSARCSAPL